jgi:hypothetical protein
MFVFTILMRAFGPIRVMKWALPTVAPGLLRFARNDGERPAET